MVNQIRLGGFLMKRFAAFFTVVVMLVVLFGVGIAEETAAESSGFGSADTVKRGSYVFLGHYPQTKAGTDSTAIEWLVLEVRDGKALLISRYALEAQPYNVANVDVTWADCSLRSWLNGAFYNKAFTDDEQACILTTDVDNSFSQGYSGFAGDGGENTQDKIFLLSYAEASQYFGVIRNGNNNYDARVVPTSHAIAAGSDTSKRNRTTDGTPAGWWWLRSPGNDQSHAMYVGSDGTPYCNDVLSRNGSVRPVMWISIGD